MGKYSDITFIIDKNHIRGTYTIDDDAAGVWTWHEYYFYSKRDAIRERRRALGLQGKHITIIDKTTGAGRLPVRG